MTITMEAFITCCASFTCVCVAAGWLIKIIKLARKPADDLNDKLKYYDECLKRDKRKLDNLDKIAISNTECLQLLLESTLTMLSHMEDNNHFGEIKAQKNKIQTYLMDKAV